MHRGRAGRGGPAVRPGHGERAQAVHGADDGRAIGGAAACLLRRAPGQQGARRAGRYRKAADQEGRYHRRRHDGRRHRDEFFERRHPRHDGGDEGRGAGARAEDHPQELRGYGQEGAFEAGGRRDPHGPPHGRAGARQARRLRPDHRGGVRADGGEEGDLRQARQHRQAGRDPGLQHLLPRHRRDRRGDEAAGPRARAALLLAGQRHAPARDRARQGRLRSR